MIIDTFIAARIVPKRFKTRVTLLKPLIKRMKPRPNAVYTHVYNTNYFDCHCHLEKTLPKLKSVHKSGYHLNQFPKFVEENCSDNFAGCITISCSASSFKPITSMLHDYPNHPVYNKLFATFGCHPHYARDWTTLFRQKTIDALTANIHQRVVGVGECGLDYYRMKCDKETQKRVFVDQIQIAMELKLPLVVHSRQAEQDTIDIMQAHCDKNHSIHLHCFTDSIQMAHVMLDSFPNLFIGVTGAVTFDSAVHLRELMQTLPLDRIILETDSPYMTPNPYRGTTCHSGYIPIIAETVAHTKDIETEYVLQRCYDNAIELYKLPTV
eukprot:308147_1